MVGNDLGNEGEPQPGAVFTARNEGFKNIGGNLGRDAGAGIDDFNLQRQRRRAAILAAQAQRQVIEGVQADRPPLARPLAGLGCVLDQVEKDLKQLVRIGIGGGERGIVIFGDLHMGGEADHGGFAGAIQRVMDVDRAAFGWAEIAELFHLFQQFDDAAGFFDDQIGKFAIFGRPTLFGAAADLERALQQATQHALVGAPAC